MARRTQVALRIGEAGLSEVDRIAEAATSEEKAVSRSDVLRLAIKHGLPLAARELGVKGAKR